MDEDIDQLLAVVDAAHVCALDPSHLPRLLEFLNRYLGAAGVHVVHATPQRWELHALCESEAGADSWYRRRWSLPPASGFDLARMAARQPFSFAEFPAAFRSHVENQAPGEEDWSSGFASVVVTETNCLALIIVPRCERLAAETARCRLHRLHPCLRRTFMSMKQMAEHVLPMEVVGAMVRRLPVTCILIDTAGRCVERNDAWTKLQPKIGMKITAGRAGFEDPHAQVSWYTAVYEAARDLAHISVNVSSPQGRQWKAHLQPLLCRAGLPYGPPLRFVLVVFEERTWGASSPPSSFSVDKLTPAEVDVLSGLLQGYTARVIARARGASVNTVRSQIVAILGKTGHRSQKELIATFSAFDPRSLGSRVG